MQIALARIVSALHSHPVKLAEAALVITAFYFGLNILAAPHIYAMAIGQQTGSGGNATLAAVNTATIAFREGLEAVLILASLMGSLKRGEARKLRLPLWLGAALSLVAVVLTWLLAAGILNVLADFGERLEAVVSLIAVCVLLLITNWFFHKVYWTGWIANFHKKKGKLVNTEVGRWIGLVFLGFASTYREGFEVVLLSQAIVLQAGSRAALTGIGLGFLGVLLVGIIVFGLQVKLPYQKMLVVTGILIGWVLFLLVGNTVDTFQSVGWLPVHPIGTFHSPTWLTLTLGIFPTWEGILLQLAAAIFVIGSFFLARHQQHQKNQVQTGERVQGFVSFPKRFLEKILELIPMPKARHLTDKPVSEVIVVEQGRVVERGTHEALLSRNGLYAHLYREQVAKALSRKKENDRMESSLRIFISSATPEDERAMEVAQRLLYDLQAAGAEVVTADATVAREDFVTYLNQELSRCQYLLLVQTPLARKSLRVQTSLNVAFNLVAQQRMKGVLRLVAVPGENETEQLFWGKSHVYDASEDYASARDQLFLELGLLKSQEKSLDLVHHAPTIIQTNRMLSTTVERSLSVHQSASQEELHTSRDDILLTRKSARIENRRSRYHAAALQQSTSLGNIQETSVQALQRPSAQRQLTKRIYASNTTRPALSTHVKMHRSAHPQDRTIHYQITEEKEIFQRGDERVSEWRKQPSREVHWLFPVGMGMLVMLALMVGGIYFTSWWKSYQLNTTYGFPRTWQTDQVVGIDHDSSLHPSHFIFENLNGHVIFIVIPAGDFTKARIYSVATLSGDDVASIPVTATFKDMNRDGKPDIFIHIGDQTIIYLNTGTGFQPER